MYIYLKVKKIWKSNIFYFNNIRDEIKKVVPKIDELIEKLVEIYNKYAKEKVWEESNDIEYIKHHGILKIVT